MREHRGGEREREREREREKEREREREKEKERAMYRGNDSVADPNGCTILEIVQQGRGSSTKSISPRAHRSL